MDSNSTTPTATELFAGEAWFDPIEAGLRDRVRGFIEEMVEQELAAALGRSRRGGWTNAGGGMSGRLTWASLLGRQPPRPPGPIPAPVPRRLLPHRRPAELASSSAFQQIGASAKKASGTGKSGKILGHKPGFTPNGAHWTPSNGPRRPSSANMRPGTGRKTAQSRPEGLESPSSSCLHPARGRDRVPSGMPTNGG